MSRGFPRTHRFAQARLVFEVARARCAEVFDAPGIVTLWSLPPYLEDQFDARWARWLESRAEWIDFFAAIEDPVDDVLSALRKLELVSAEEAETVSRLRRSAEGRAVPLPATDRITDALITQLAAGFARGEPGRVAVPYARTEA